MSSFYGGVDGRPFIIKKPFSTVSEMIAEFQRGHSYKDVNYGEYVIIDTINKNNPENGRIFRRSADLGVTQYIETWDLNAEKNIFERTPKQFNGAIYVGQIVGPSGNAPHLEFKQTIAQVEKIYADTKNKPGYDTRTGSGTFSLSDNNLIPGKTAAGEYNDKIIWTYCSIRDENQQETNAYIGFTIPYMIVEWDAKSESPYYNRDDADYDENGEIIPESLTNDFDNINLVDREDDTTHPFYQKWKINVPKGIHGMDIRNVRVIDAAKEGSNVVSFVLDADTNLPKYNTAKNALLTEAYPGQDEDINQPAGVKRSIWVCDVIDYNVKETGQKYIIYLGDYNVIDEITLSDTGTFTIDYSHADNFVRNNLIKWITGMSLNPENGAFKVDFNNEDPSFEQKITWVKDIEMQVGTPENPGDGTIKIYYTHRNGMDNDIETHSKILNWITELSFDSETGHFILKTNNDNINDIDKSLTWIKEFTLSDTGVLNFKTTTGEHDINNRQLHWVKGVSTNEDTGIITYTDIDGTSTTEQLTWVRDVDFNKDGTVTVKYTTNKADTVYENLIEYPKEVYISPMGEISAVTNTGKTLSEYQDNLKWMTSAELSQDGTFTRIDNHGDETKQEDPLKWVEGVSLAQDGTLTKHFNNIDFSEEEQSEKLIWPVNIHINSADGKVVTTYNNGEENSSQNPQLDWIESATLSNDKQLQIDFINTDSISVDLKTPNKIELTHSGDFLVYYNSDPDTAVHLGNIGELGSISACAAKAEEDVPGELKVGGLWFVIQEESEEEVE